MMRKPNVISAILCIVAFYQIALASEFVFVTMIDDTPYIIVNDYKAISMTQAVLLHSFLIGDTYEGEQAIRLDTTAAETLKRLSLYWDVYEYKLWPIAGPSNYMKYTTGYAPGDVLNMQVITEDGSGAQMQIEVDKAFYNVAGPNASILLKCKPVILGPAWNARRTHYTGSPYFVASLFGGQPASPMSLFDPTIPEVVKSKIDELIAETIPAAVASEYQSVTIQPIRALPPRGLAQEPYYAAILSYGEKGGTRFLFLFNSRGEIVQKLENKHMGFNRIIGVTDVDRNGIPELIVFVGNQYGGGIEVFQLSWDEDKTTVFLKKDGGIDTVFD